MALDITCHNCNATFKVSEKFIGQKGNCPKCCTEITIPWRNAMFVIYDDGQEVIVTTPEAEPTMLQAYFEEGDRDKDNYDRTTSNEPQVAITSRVKID